MQSEPNSGWIADQPIEAVSFNSWSPTLASGPDGILHAAWQSNTDRIGNWDILYSSSSDGGRSWKEAVTVAGSSSPETTPDIAVSPVDGRVFVVYVWNEGEAYQVNVSYYDQGANWQSVSVVDPVPFPLRNPTIISEHQHHRVLSPSYAVYVAFEGQPFVASDIRVYVSLDSGTSYSLSLCYACFPLPHPDFGYPALAYRVGRPFGGGNMTEQQLDQVFLAYLTHKSSGLWSVSLRWSENYGDSWNSPGPVTIFSGDADPVSPTIAASRDGGSLAIAWQQNETDESSVGYGYHGNPNFPSDGWEIDTLNSPGVREFRPKLAADGDGTDSVEIGGSFHLTWTTDSPQHDVWYASSPTDTFPTWEARAVVSDLEAMASANRTAKDIATQDRGGGWYPCILWADFRNLLPSSIEPYDIYYVTPGSRVTVKTDPVGLTFNVDGTEYTSQMVFDWPAGLDHLLDLPPLQQTSPDLRHVFEGWSGTQAQAYRVTADLLDRIYVATFNTEYRVHFDTMPPGFEVEIDGNRHTAPQDFWWEEGSSHTLDVPSPQPSGLDTRYVWSSWSDDLAQSHEIIAMGVDQTYTASLIREYLVKIETVPLGLRVEVDGILHPTPVSFWWEEGSQHVLGAEERQGALVYQSWSDEGGLAHAVTVTGPTTYVATYSTEGSFVSFLAWIIIPILLIVAFWRLSRPRRLTTR